MALPAEVTGVSEWRTRSIGIGFQTFEIDAEGALRLFRFERQMQANHPPRPALLDPGYTDWLRVWTTLDVCPPAVGDFSGTLRLEGRDHMGAEWAIEAEIESGQCESFQISQKHAEVCGVAA